MINLPEKEYNQVTENGKTITYCTMRQKAMHTIGLDSCYNGRRLYKRYGTQYYKPYRNYFCGNDSDLDRLVKAGYMESFTDKKSYGEETTYWFNRRGLDWLGKQLNIIIRDEEGQAKGRRPMTNQNDGPAVTVTTDTLDRLRNRLQPGDRITYATPVTRNDEGGLAHNKYRRMSGTVIKKYTHLVQAQDKAGKVVTVAYRDIVAIRKRRKS